MTISVAEKGLIDRLGREDSTVDTAIMPSTTVGAELEGQTENSVSFVGSTAGRELVFLELNTVDLVMAALAVVNSIDAVTRLHVNRVGVPEICVGVSGVRL